MLEQGLPEVQGGVYVGDALSFPALNKPFWAQITAVSGGLYTWSEQVPFSPTPVTFAPLPGGRFGSPTQNPAVTPNGEVLATPAFAKLERGFFDKNLGWVYVIIDKLGGGSTSSATNAHLNDLSGGVNIAPGTTNSISWLAYDYKNGGNWTTLPASQISTGQGGVYAYGAFIEIELGNYTPVAGDVIRIYLTVNGASSNQVAQIINTVGTTPLGASNRVQATISSQMNLNEFDSIQVQITNNTAVTISVLGDCLLWLAKVG